MNAKLQFTHYKVLEIVYNSSLNELEEEEIVTPSFSVDIIVQEKDYNKAMIKLGVELTDESSNSYVKAVIAGFFVFESDEEMMEEEVVKYYRLNGVAILFPYLRSLVSDVTSKSDSSPVILPTINIQKMLFDSEED